MESELQKKIKDYWDQQAVLNREKTDSLKVIDWESDYFIDSKGQGGTLKDSNLRELEIQNVVREIRKGEYVLDIGCGNGYSTLEYAKRLKDVRLLGIDFSKEMIKNAISLMHDDYPQLVSRVRFECHDILELSALYEEEFDVVCSTRVVINLPSWQLQQQALDEIRKVLKRGGRLILLEGSVDAVERLNAVRAKLKMKMDRAGNWHNVFLRDEDLKNYIRGKYKLIKEIYHASTYMLITRVLYHKVILGKFIKQFTYDEEIFDAASKLPNFGEYGYHKIFVLQKI